MSCHEFSGIIPLIYIELGFSFILIGLGVVLLIGINYVSWFCSFSRFKCVYHGLAQDQSIRDRYGCANYSG